MDWWVTKGDRRPVGPVSTQLLLRGIGAGKVPRDALVCEVGGTSWKWIGEIAPFSAAIDERRIRRRLESSDDLTLADPPTSDEFLREFEDAREHTTVDRSPLRLSEPPPRPWLERFDDPEENTIVDVVPLRPSNPPTEP
jgi:hypothetical protein